MVNNINKRLCADWEIFTQLIWYSVNVSGSDEHITFNKVISYSY